MHNSALILDLGYMLLLRIIGIPTFAHNNRDTYFCQDYWVDVSSAQPIMVA